MFVLAASIAMMAEPGGKAATSSSCAAWQETFPTTTLDASRWTIATGQAPGYIPYTHIGYYEPYNVQIPKAGVLQLGLTQVAGTVDGSSGIVSHGAMIYTNQVCGYGTYSWTMKMSSTALCADSSCTGEAVSGGVSAGFLYVNNSQTEIDFEFQGQDANSLYLVNWLNTNPSSDPTGRNETFTRYTPFNAIDGQHSYTFVWSRRKISYYIDGKWIVDHKTNVPSAPAYFMINHWGTNSTNWGGLATTGIARYFYITKVSYTP